MKDNKAIYLKEHNTLKTYNQYIKSFMYCINNIYIYSVSEDIDLVNRIYKEIDKNTKKIKRNHRINISVSESCSDNFDINEYDLSILIKKNVSMHNGMCFYCKTCPSIRNCKSRAMQRICREVHIDKEKCIGCGECIKRCHFKIVERDKPNYKIYIKNKLIIEVNTQNELLEFIDKLLDFYKNIYDKYESFSQMINSIGIDYIKDTLNKKFIENKY
ncbi:4Fe-4S binding protein [Romboutsia sp. 1001713B170131_170501_G6]|uniref:4Fe-4S binding protein n=1 Tax=Romboutsia sp. 1001713B170131_170501_G6 TaxID=2787108 RepID=UPI0018AAB232|nr:4Fe-4S binding protein [Romboutsia sp. 1001713B170131_170501_G6]